MITLILSLMLFSDFQLASASDIAYWQSLVPQFEAAEYNRLFQDPQLIWYTDKEIVPCFQKNDNNDGTSRVVWAKYNMSGTADFKGIGNGNNGDFPWFKTAGLDHTKNTRTIKFFRLPESLPAIYWLEKLPGDSSNSYCWIFPLGTLFGELLVMRHDNIDYCWEVRLRKRTTKGWEPDVLRPFPNSESLAIGIRAVSNDPTDLYLAKWCESNIDLATYRSYSNHPDVVSFKETWSMDILPPLQTETVKKLLKTTLFKTCFAETWRSYLDAECYAPTTNASFHIVPKNYLGGMVEVTPVSCMKCHSDTMRGVNDFQHSGRDWYGRIKGNDGIFSWHPFDETSASGYVSSRRLYNMGGGTKIPIKLRKSFLDNGLIEKYDPEKHSVDKYTFIKMGGQ